MPAYKNLSRQISDGIRDVHSFSGQSSHLAHSKLTNKSYAFNFTNKSIENEKGAPSAGASETRGQIYAGTIGAD